MLEIHCNAFAQISIDRVIPTEQGGTTSDSLSRFIGKES